MKQNLLILIILLLATFKVEAQHPRVMYNLYFLDTTMKGKPYFYTTGLGFRNDTLVVDGSALITVLAIKRDKGGYNFILLKPFRENYKYHFIYNHGNPISEANTIKKKKPKAKAKVKYVPGKLGTGEGS